MNQRGMTLVELLVVLVLASFIGFFVMNLFITSNRTFMDQNKVLDAQRDGRLVMEYVIKTLREAGLNPLASSDFEGVLFALPYAITIDRDSNLNTTRDIGEIVAFKLESSILKRGFSVGGGNMRWQGVAKNVNSLNFKYFGEDTDNDGIKDPLPSNPDPDKIRAVEITISIEDNKNIGDTFTRTYSTRVEFRNR